MTIDKEQKQYIAMACAAIGAGFLLVQKMQKPQVEWTTIIAIVSSSIGFLAVIVAIWMSFSTVNADDKRQFNQNDRQDMIYFEQKVDVNSVLSRENKNNIHDIEKENAKLNASIEGINQKVNRIDDRIDVMSNNYLTKDDFLIAINRIEHNHKENIKRLGNVMYNDRQELMRYIANTFEKNSVAYKSVNLNE